MELERRFTMSSKRNVTGLYPQAAESQANREIKFLILLTVLKLPKSSLPSYFFLIFCAIFIALILAICSATVDISTAGNIMYSSYTLDRSSINVRISLTAYLQDFLNLQAWLNVRKRQFLRNVILQCVATKFTLIKETFIILVSRHKILRISDAIVMVI